MHSRPYFVDWALENLLYCIVLYLTFEAHIDNIVQKAARRSYTIFKSFQSGSTELLVRAFTTYDMPLLEVNLEV